jgi:hypothetical protein
LNKLWVQSQLSSVRWASSKESTNCTGIVQLARVSEWKRDLELVANVAVGLLPLSRSLVEKWLYAKHGECIYELHFLLFFALVWRRGDKRSCDELVPSLVRKYLFRITALKGLYASQMAGSLMGRYWNESTGLRILMEVIRKAPHVCGKDGALTGLVALAGEGASRRVRKQAFEVLLSIARSRPKSALQRKAKISLKVLGSVL